ESPAAQEALEKLCRTYWRPIYGFVRRQDVEPEEAKDLTQGFFALLLERRDLDAVRKEKGRLRSYLLTSLKHFLTNERNRAMAIKRGEGQLLIPLEELRDRERGGFEPANASTADQLYERRWALALLDQVLTRLGDEAPRSQLLPVAGLPHSCRKRRSYENPLAHQIGGASLNKYRAPFDNRTPNGQNGWRFANRFRSIAFIACHFTLSPKCRHWKNGISPPSACSHHNVLLLQLRQHKVTLATTPNPVVSAQSAVAPLQRFNASTIYAAKPFSA